MDVPVQYFQAVIALETAVTGVLLFQIRFFAAKEDAAQEPVADPRLRLLLLLVLAATIFGSLEAIREGRGLWAAVLVTVGLAVSVLPILLRVLPPLQRDALTQQRHPHYWVTVLGLLLYAVAAALFIEALQERATLHQVWGVAASLAGLASVAAQLGKLQLAAQHFGSVEGMLTSSHSVLTPIDDFTYRRDAAKVKIEMGEMAYVSAWSEGKRLIFDEAVSHAIEVWSGPGDW